MKLKSVFDSLRRDLESLIMKEKQKYWYKFFIGECPVCGRDASYKVRMYGDKPRNQEDRYVYLSCSETYDGCMY